MKTDVQYFQCNRTGVYVSTGTGQRRIKSQGTQSSFKLDLFWYIIMSLRPKK